MPQTTARILLWDDRRLDADRSPQARIEPRLAGELPPWHTGPLELPDPVCFFLPDRVVPDTDWWWTDCRWPLMSRRMLGVLAAVGPFPHHAWPAALVGPVDEDTWEILGEDVVVLQLLEHLDVLDPASPATPDPSGADEPLLIREVHLTVPDEALPPVFRLRRRPWPLLVSPAAARALLEAECVGVDLHPARNL